MTLAFTCKDLRNLQSFFRLIYSGSLWWWWYLPSKVRISCWRYFCKYLFVFDFSTGTILTCPQCPSPIWISVRPVWKCHPVVCPWSVLHRLCLSIIGCPSCRLSVCENFRRSDICVPSSSLLKSSVGPNCAKIPFFGLLFNSEWPDLTHSCITKPN